MTEEKKRHSSVDGHPFTIASPDAFLRSTRKGHKKRIARQILRSSRADTLISRIGTTRKELEAIAYPPSRR